MWLSASTTSPVREGCGCCWTGVLTRCVRSVHILRLGRRERSCQAQWGAGVRGASAAHRQLCRHVRHAGRQPQRLALQQQARLGLRSLPYRVGPVRLHRVWCGVRRIGDKRIRGCAQGPCLFPPKPPRHLLIQSQPLDIFVLRIHFDLSEQALPPSACPGLGLTVPCYEATVAAGDGSAALSVPGTLDVYCPPLQYTE